MADPLFDSKRPSSLPLSPHEPAQAGASHSLHAYSSWMIIIDSRNGLPTTTTHYRFDTSLWQSILSLGHGPLQS